MLVDVDKMSVEPVSDGPSEITSQPSDSSAVNSAGAGSAETSRRGKRNRRDRHKNSSKTTSESVTQLMDLERHSVSHPPVNLADSQSSARNKSSAISSSSPSSVGGKEVSKGSMVDGVKLSSFPLCPPPSSSISGNVFYSACV